MKLKHRSYADKQRMMAYNLIRRREAEGWSSRLKAALGYAFTLGAVVATIILMLVEMARP